MFEIDIPPILRKINFEYGSVAQLVEHLTFNQVALGSSPSRPTIKSVSYGDVTSLISSHVTLL